MLYQITHLWEIISVFQQIFIQSMRVRIIENIHSAIMLHQFQLEISSFFLQYQLVTIVTLKINIFSLLSKLLFKREHLLVSHIV